MTQQQEIKDADLARAIGLARLRALKQELGMLEKVLGICQPKTDTPVKGWVKIEAGIASPLMHSELDA